jgi:hypothetical protein
VKSAVLLSAVLILVGCDLRTELPTLSIEPGAPIAGLIVDGRLVHDPATGCVELLLVSNERLALIWAHGFTANFEPLRVFDRNGVLVGSENEHVFLGASAGGPAQPQCDAEQSLYVTEVSHDLVISPD